MMAAQSVGVHVPCPCAKHLLTQNAVIVTLEV